MRDLAGDVVSVPEQEVQGAIERGYELEGAEGRAARIRGEEFEKAYGGVAGTAVGAGRSILRGATLGLSDLGGESEAAKYQREKLGLAGVGLEVAGSLLPGLITGGTATGASLAREGASLLPTTLAVRAGQAVGGGIRGAAVEGGLYGLGTGVSQLGLSENPLDVETVFSTLGSNMLLGGAAGAAGSILAKAAQKGVAKVGDYAKRLSAGGADDAIAKTALVDDLGKYRTAFDENNLTVALKGSTGELGKQNAALVKADRALKHQLGNPKGLARNPRRALDALERQEIALLAVKEQAPELLAKYAAEGSEGGFRATAVNNIDNLLTHNAALQERIGALAASTEAGLLGKVANKGSLIAEGAITGLAGSALTALGVPPQLAYPIAGAGSGWLADKAASLLTGRFAKAGAEASERISAAVAGLTTAAKAAEKALPPLAAKTLTSLRYSGEAPQEPIRRKPSANATVEAYHQRAAELRSQVAPDEMGALRMRPEAREKVFERLAGVRMVNSIIADKLETATARKVEFLASKLPTRLAPAAIAGPDSWRPSDFEISKFARYAAAAEDPAGVIERAKAGTITPEDGETIRAVYPEIFNKVVNDLVEQLPKAESLPYQQRLGLSILTGIPADPALQPNVLRRLQGNYQFEPGTDGGMGPPRAQAQFGSIKNSAETAATPAQERASGNT